MVIWNLQLWIEHNIAYAAQKLPVSIIAKTREAYSTYEYEKI
jgi:hypothetical protein